MGTRFLWGEVLSTQTVGVLAEAPDYTKNTGSHITWWIG